MLETTNYSTSILEALACAGKEPDLVAVTVPPLLDALAACLKIFFTTLETSGRCCPPSAADNHVVLRQQVAVCKVLGEMLEKPEARQVCAERLPECVQVLAQTIARHPTEHEIQVHAQWALSQLVGVMKTLEVAKPFFHSPKVISAFLWIAAEAKEDLVNDLESTLLTSAMQRVADADADADMHQHCFELIGARLRADNLEGTDSEKAKRYRLAAESVHVLVHGIARWLPSYEGQLAVVKAGEALWKVCRGGSAQPVCNPQAQQRLSSLENEQHILVSALQDPMQHISTQKAITLQGQLSELLASVHGLPGLVALLSSRNSTDSSTDNQWTILRSIANLHDFVSIDAANAVHAIVGAVGQTHNYTLVEQAVKALAWLMEGMQSQLASLPANDVEKVVMAMRCGAEGVLKYISWFMEARAGRWPSMSARALQAAAFADTSTCQALGMSEQLQVAVQQRITGACQRCDTNTYSELESTFALALILWGVGRTLRILHDALDNPEDLQREARHYLIQCMCRALADTQEDLSPQDAKAVLKVVLKAKEKVIQMKEPDPETFGPMAAALGHALKGIGHSASASTCENEQADRDMVVGAVAALVGFLDCTVDLDNVFLVQEICWGVCTAACPCRAAFAQAGAPEKLETVAEMLLSRALTQPYKHKDEANALTEVLEALGRLRASFIPVVSVMQRCQHVLSVQIACLRAICNLLDDDANVVNSQEGEALFASCRAVLARFGEQDERVRSSAERIVGLLSQMR